MIVEKSAQSSMIQLQTISPLWTTGKTDSSEEDENYYYLKNFTQLKHKCWDDGSKSECKGKRFCST